MATPIPDSIELFKSGLGGEGIYLGSPGAVEKIVRHALNRCATMREQQLKGETGDIQETVRSLARTLQRIFYGQESGFKPSAWHSPLYLGEALVTRARMGGTVDDAPYRLLMRMFGEFFKAYGKFEADEMEDADFDAEVQRIVHFYTKILAGAAL